MQNLNQVEAYRVLPVTVELLEKEIRGHCNRLTNRTELSFCPTCQVYLDAGCFHEHLRHDPICKSLTVD